MGVTSLIIVTSSPAVCRARIAASRPEPGPLTKTSTVFRPCSIAALAAVSAAVCAAKGVDFLLPRKPMPPAEAQESALPWVSVMVTMVLLNEELICTAPFSMFLRSLRRVRTFLPFAAFAITYPSLTSSYWRSCVSGPCGYAHWSCCAGRARAGRVCDAGRGSSRSRSGA